MARLTEKEKEQRAKEAAQLLILSGSSLASSFLGPEAAMEPDEAAAIERPLARIMERLQPEILEAVSTLTDPAALIFALLNWGARLAEVARKRQAEREAEEKDVQAQRVNGQVRDGIENVVNHQVAEQLGSDGKFQTGAPSRDRLAQGDTP